MSSSILSSSSPTSIYVSNTAASLTPTPPPSGAPRRVVFSSSCGSGSGGGSGASGGSGSYGTASAAAAAAAVISLVSLTSYIGARRKNSAIKESSNGPNNGKGGNVSGGDKESSLSSSSASSPPRCDLNTALVFIKPHAQTPHIHAFVQAELEKKRKIVVRQQQQQQANGTVSTPAPIPSAAEVSGANNKDVREGQVSKMSNGQVVVEKQVFKVIKKGTLKGTTIREKGIIDKHYAAIGHYAMSCEGRRLLDLFFGGNADKSKASSSSASPSACCSLRKQFLEKYNIAVDDAVKGNLLLNAAEVMRLYGLSPKEVTEGFEKGKALGTMMRIAPGCYTCRLVIDEQAWQRRCRQQQQIAKEGSKEGQSSSPPSPPPSPSSQPPAIIIVNGFYLSMREEYIRDDAQVTWLIVQWAEADLSWRAFREEVLGATDPTRAPMGSIRSLLMHQYNALGLSDVPTMASNGVHGSASPLEALNERLVWVGEEAAAIAADNNISTHSSINSNSNGKENVANKTTKSNSLLSSFLPLLSLSSSSTIGQKQLLTPNDAESIAQHRIETDVYGAYLVRERGLNPEQIKKLLKNTPVEVDVVEEGSGGPAAKGNPPTTTTKVTKPLFDVVEAMNSTECADALVKLVSKL